MIRRRPADLQALHRRLAAQQRDQGPARAPLRETSIERAVAGWLADDGLGAVAQHRLLPTVTVDFWLPEHGLVIECQGTYFHADPAHYAGRRLTAEQRRKQARDAALARYVERAGLRLLVLWEEEIRSAPEACRQRLRAACGRAAESIMALVERHWTSPEGMAIAVCRGDLTAEAVDAIVNAANGHLSHGGGVAAAIVRRGGSVIQTESDAWVRAHGPLPTGEVAITGAGSLPAKAVIHAVGPVWHGGGQQEPDLLRRAVTGALALAAAQGFESVALPAISSGIFGFPKPLCAEILIDAAVAWSHAHPAGPLREVRFTNIDAATTAELVAAFESRFGAGG